MGTRLGSAVEAFAFAVLLGEVVGESVIRDRGCELTCLVVRGGVGERSCRASSSESRISSMSMKRPEPVGGVDSILVLVFDFARGFKIGVDDVETDVGIAECDFVGLPRFLGEPSMGVGAEAGGLKIETGDFRICAEGGKSKSSMSTKLSGETGF